MIVIPMAGMSSRFFNYGYALPKYMLKLQNKSVFYHSISSFNKYFNDELFVFICRDISDTINFIEAEVEALGIKKYKIIELLEETQGQAETVVKGIESLNLNEHLIIFNIDTFRSKFTIDYQKINSSSGYLETFIGEGDNWSNAVLDFDGNVVSTSEKQEDSLYCSTGLYVFSNGFELIEAFEESKLTGVNMYNGEFYIAPLYNFLLQRGGKVLHSIINVNDVIFCGTPSEYIFLGGTNPKGLDK